METAKNMNLLERIKRSFNPDEDSTLIKPAELVELGNLQVQLTELRNDIRDNFTALGGEVYVLYTTRKLNVLQDVMKDHVRKLEDLKDEMDQKEQQFEKLKTKYEEQSISRKELQALKEELDNANACLQRVEVKHASPVVGKKICELEPVENVSFALIIRDGKSFVPGNQTALKAEDIIFVIGNSETVIQLGTVINPEH